ncbi:NUDIX hydrolase [Rhodotorula taiwanensis]|uniref:NUDIX hydrolase n=1 Tax=Rhodotorula taiwanensis TaxID=741276 RepID=A0A2S5BH92_9BASI|nr:NUDIX hydrolase [Rhodotorula taiwanensis]
MLKRSHATAAAPKSATPSLPDRSSKRPRTASDKQSIALDSSEDASNTIDLTSDATGRVVSLFSLDRLVGTALTDTRLLTAELFAVFDDDDDSAEEGGGSGGGPGNKDFSEEEENISSKLATLEEYAVRPLSGLDQANWTSLDRAWKAYLQLEIARNPKYWKGLDSTGGLVRTHEWRSRSFDEALLRSIDVPRPAADAAAAGTLDSFAPRFADLASEKEMADTDRPLVYILIKNDEEAYLGYSKSGVTRLVDGHEVAEPSERMAAARADVPFDEWRKKVVATIKFHAPFVLLFGEHMLITLTNATVKGLNTLAFDFAGGSGLSIKKVKAVMIEVFDILAPFDPKLGKRVPNGTRLNKEFLAQHTDKLFAIVPLKIESIYHLLMGYWLPWIARTIFAKEGVDASIFPRGRWPMWLIADREERDAAFSDRAKRRAALRSDGWYDLPDANHTKNRLVATAAAAAGPVESDNLTGNCVSTNDGSDAGTSSRSEQTKTKTKNKTGGKDRRGKPGKRAQSVHAGASANAQWWA